MATSMRTMVGLLVALSSSGCFYTTGPRRSYDSVVLQGAPPPSGTIVVTGAPPPSGVIVAGASPQTASGIQVVGVDTSSSAIELSAQASVSVSGGSTVQIVDARESGGAYVASVGGGVPATQQGVQIVELGEVGATSWPSSEGSGAIVVAPAAGDTVHVSTAPGGAVAVAGDASGGAVASDPFASAAVDVAVAPIGGVRITGNGRGLLSLAGEGMRIDGQIAALGLLTPLAGAGTFAGSARVGGDVSISIDASLAHDALPQAGGPTSVVLRVAGGQPPASVPPLRVHLVIDASTSMESTWSQLQAAAVQLIGRLRPEDELQIVVYGTGAREALRPIRVGNGEEARRVVRGLRPAGRTNIEAGLRIAYGAIREHASVVILLSDGVPNGGLATPAELGGLAAEAHARGAVTTAIGIGWDFHPGVLRALATEGQGSFRIAPRVAELGAVLEAELTARGRVAAHDVSVSVSLGQGVRIAGELPTGMTAVDGGVRLSMPSIAAGEERILVVPVEVPPGVDARSVARIDASWKPVATGVVSRASKPLAIAVAAQPVLAGGALAVLDADLSMALGLAADAVANNQAADAARLLRAHAERVRVHANVRVSAPLTARIQHVDAFATALERTVPQASWGDRRALGAAMLSFSVSLGR